MMHAEWTVRGSGRFPGKHYIDVAGKYGIEDISSATGIDRSRLEALYRGAGASADNNLGVWFFDTREAALAVIREIEALQTGSAGRMVFLTHEEIDYIRQALINEGSNVISVLNELKRHIFDKFNG